MKYKHKEYGWIVEIISETKTHYYLKYFNLGTNYRSNKLKDYFDEQFEPLKEV